MAPRCPTPVAALLEPIAAICAGPAERYAAHFPDAYAVARMGHDHFKSLQGGEEGYHRAPVRQQAARTLTAGTGQPPPQLARI